MIQNKQKDESYISFAKRITDAYENRLINIDEWGVSRLKMIEKRLGKKLIYLTDK